MASVLRGTAPPVHSPRQPQQLHAAAAASTSQQQQRWCRAERAGSIAFRERRRRQGLLQSTSPSPAPTSLSASAAAAPTPSRRPAAVAASASRRAAAAAVVQAAPPSLFDPAAVSEAIKAFFSSLPLPLPAPLPPLPSSLAAAVAAAAALPPARRDALAALATAIGAYALVKFFDKVATKGWLDQVRERKKKSLFFLPFLRFSLSLALTLLSTASPPPPPRLRTN